MNIFKQTKAEKREKRKEKTKKHKLSGAKVRDLARLIEKKTKQAS